jgi:hypothetical protein
MANKYIILLIVIIMLLIPLPWTGYYPKFSLYMYIKNVIIKELHKTGIVPLNKQVCRDNLRLIYEIFEQHNIFFWLSDGTALGFARDNDIIDWDDDIDLAIWDKDHKKLLDCLPELKQNGFEVAEVIMGGTFIVLLRNNEKVDIDIVGAKHKCSPPQQHPCTDVIPHLRRFKRIVIDRLTYNIPHQGYLKFAYGKTWRIPQNSKPNIINKLFN